MKYTHCWVCGYDFDEERFCVFAQPIYKDIVFTFCQTCAHEASAIDMMRARMEAVILALRELDSQTTAAELSFQPNAPEHPDDPEFDTVCRTLWEKCKPGGG